MTPNPEPKEKQTIEVEGKVVFDETGVAPTLSMGFSTYEFIGDRSERKYRVIVVEVE